MSTKRVISRTMPTIQTAIDILGSDRVVDSAETSKKYNWISRLGDNWLPLSSGIIRNSEEQLIAAYEENKKGSDYYLLPLNGFSFAEMLAIFGMNIRIRGGDARGSSMEERFKSLPFFDVNFLKYSRQSWFHKAYEPGYRLIDLSGKCFSRRSREEEEAVIMALGDIERADDAIFIEAMFTCFLFIKNLRPWAVNWFHTGNSIDELDGMSIYVGGFGFNGWQIGKGFATGGSEHVATVKKFVEPIKLI